MAIRYNNIISKKKEELLNKLQTSLSFRCIRFPLFNQGPYYIISFLNIFQAVISES